MAEYMKSLTGSYLPFPELTKMKTALIIIDMQYLASNWETGFIRKLRDIGHEEKLSYFRDRILIVASNIRRLQEKFRQKGMEVMFIRSGTMTTDGRERSTPDKDRGIIAKPGSKEAQILEELKPAGDEIVLNKTSSSAFNSTNIDYILRNIGIECLVITGMQTSMCVEATVMDASDRGYSIILVEDACLNMLRNPHEVAIRKMNGIQAAVKKTHELLGILDKL